MTPNDAPAASPREPSGQVLPDTPSQREPTVSKTVAQDFEYDVAIIGLGLVGLPMALAYHASGAKVLGTDVSADRLISIATDLAGLAGVDRARLTEALTDDRFQLTSDVSMITRARAVIVCVPTPIDKYFVPELTALRAACASVVQHATTGQLLMLTSTTYVGCTQDLLAAPVSRRALRVGEDVFVAFSAERIDPGNTSVRQEEVPHVVGGATAACEERAAQTLAQYAQTVHRVPSLATAEMTKLLENTFRTVDIPLANGSADICRTTNLDVTQVIDAAPQTDFTSMPTGSSGPRSHRAGAVRSPTPADPERSEPCLLPNAS